MQEVRVSKTVLMDKVKENRKNHRAIFEEAFEGYTERMEKILQAKLEAVRKGSKVEHYIRIPIPEDHTSDYDRVLEMLEMSLDEDITLTQADFAMYVMDQWQWRESFYSNTVSYTAGGAPPPV